MKQTAYRYYWEFGEGKKINELSVFVVASSLETSIQTFVKNYPDYPVEFIRNIEVLSEPVISEE